MHHPLDMIVHTTAFVTPVMEHWLEREIARWVHPMKDPSDDPSHHERTLLPRSYISLRGYTVSDIWQRIADSERGTRCRHMGYSFRIIARVILYTPSHRQDSTYHSLCYTSRGALAGTRNHDRKSNTVRSPHSGV